MVEAAKELLDLIKHAPEYTMWVLCGILFYKVFIIGSWIAIARLLINKVYDYLTTPIEKTIEYDINDRFITRDGAHIKFFALIDQVRKLNKNGINSNYLHMQDVEWLEKAIIEKIEREKNG